MKRKYIILAVVSIVAVLLDQVTKIWAKGLRGAPPIEIIENYFHFIYVENTGAAWGMFGDLPEAVRVPFFVGISIFAIGFILFFFRKIEDDHNFLILALSFVLGGALGNFIDRVVYNSVIDFIDWHYYRYHWPTFNVADIFISVGVAMLVYEMIFGHSELSIFVSTEDDKKPAKSEKEGEGV